MVSRLVFSLVCLLVSGSAMAQVKPCAQPATLDQLMQSGTLANLRSLLQGKSVAPGHDYIWRLPKSETVNLRIASEAPHQVSVYVKEAGGYVPLQWMCADGTNTLMGLQFSITGLGTQKVQIQVVNRGGIQMAAVFLNGKPHGPEAQVGSLSAQPFAATGIATGRTRPGRE